MSPLRLKVEINTREHVAVYGYQTRRLAVEYRWVGAGADVRTFHLDELLGTKLRALYQRRRGRDLFDLRDASRRGDVNPVRVIEEVTPMLAPGVADGARAALDLVHREFIERLPGDAGRGG